MTEVLEWVGAGPAGGMKRRLVWLERERERCDWAQRRPVQRRLASRADLSSLGLQDGSQLPGQQSERVEGFSFPAPSSTRPVFPEALSLDFPADPLGQPWATALALVAAAPGKVSVTCSLCSGRSLQGQRLGNNVVGWQPGVWDLVGSWPQPESN